MKKQRIPKRIKGYTLIELTVALVMLSLMGIFLLSSSLRINKTRSSLIMDSDTISSLIRSMQNKTTSFVLAEGVENVGYGVFFNINNNFKVESFYKLSEEEFDAVEILSPRKPEVDFVLSGGNYIKKICINDCAETTSRAAIYFLKPRPYAKFAIFNGISYSTTTTSTKEPITKICIEINSPSKGKRGSESRYIEVYSIGQISFSNGFCQ